MAKVKILGDVSSGRDNNLNLMRLVAAALVALSHSYLIVNGEGSSQPLADLTGFTLGYHAVNIFFVVSGFLVIRSWHRSSSLTHFGAARAFRILPALIVCVVITALIVLPFVSSLSLWAYFTSPQTMAYVPLTATLVTPDAILPGVFETNPVPFEVNGSLWTLRYEIVCYAALAVLGMLGVFSNRLKMIAVFAVLSAPLIVLSFMPTLFADITPVQHLVRFGLCFGLGVLAHELRDVIPLHWSGVAALLASACVAHGTAAFPVALYVFVAYASLWVAFIPEGPVRKFNQFGDISYGLYIYAFPIQQLLIYHLPGLEPLELFVATLAVTIPVATLSWLWIEQPMLTHKDEIYGLIRRALRLSPARA